MRRSTVLAVAAAAVSLVGLVGCDDGAAPTASSTASPAATTPEAAPTSAPATAPTPAPTAAATPEPTTVATPAPAATAPAATTAGGVIDPEAALALAEKTPYAATQDFISDGGPISAVIKARVNLNGPIRSGRLAESMTVGGEEMMSDGNDSPSVVVTDDGTTYIRNGSSWRTSPLGNRIADYHGYAKAVLALGPSARKGMEDCEGTPCYHLSGTVDLEQMKAVEPEQYKILKGKAVENFQLDQWIDAQGRTVRYDKKTELRGIQMRTYGTFRDFGPVEKVDPPR